MKKVFFYCISISIIIFMIFNLGSFFKDEIFEEKEYNVIQKIEPVVSYEEKITKSTKGKMSISYLGCGHREETALDLNDTFINLNEEKFKEKFVGWNVKSFSNEEVEIEKEFDGYCYNHFIVKLAENKIVIYRKINNIDEELFRETDIGEEFLTEEDRLTLEKGIEVYAVENLNSILEDFE